MTRSLPVPKGATLRELPIHPQLRTDLQLWLDERPDWSHAQTNPANPALLLNRRGGRLTTRGASDIFHTIATNAGLDDTVTAHIGRHTFVTTLEMSRIASDATFGKIGERLLPATSPFGADQGQLVEASSHAS